MLHLNNTLIILQYCCAKHIYMKYRFVSKNLDFVGFCLSFFCAMHCAIRPFILSLAPISRITEIQ